MAKLYVVDRHPAEYASGVPINDVVWVQFSTQIDSSTASYYNFTVNKRDDYDPLEGSVVVQGVSGGLNEAIAVFVPTNGFARNTEYSVLVSTGIKAKNTDDYLADDNVWYFTTGSTATSGTIGDDIYDLDPSGFTTDDSSVYDGSVALSTGDPLEVLETTPKDYATNVLTTTPYIGIRFNGRIYSGLSLYDHLTITTKRVLG